MKASELNLASVVYIVTASSIKEEKVHSVRKSDGKDLLVSFASHPMRERNVAPDVEYCKGYYDEHILFSIDAAKRKQERLRSDYVESKLAGLQRAAQEYADALRSYGPKIPLSEPTK